MSHLSALAEGCDARWAELSEQQGAGASEGAGRRQSPLLLTRPIKPVFKRLLKLYFSFPATEEKGSGKPDCLLVSAKITT